MILTHSRAPRARFSRSHWTISVGRAYIFAIFVQFSRGLLINLSNRPPYLSSSQHWATCSLALCTGGLIRNAITPCGRVRHAARRHIRIWLEVPMEEVRNRQPETLRDPVHPASGSQLGTPSPLRAEAHSLAGPWPLGSIRRAANARMRIRSDPNSQMRTQKQGRGPARDDAYDGEGTCWLRSPIRCRILETIPDIEPNPTNTPCTGRKSTFVPTG